MVHIVCSGTVYGVHGYSIVTECSMLVSGTSLIYHVMLYTMCDYNYTEINSKCKQTKTCMGKYITL